MSRFVKKSVEVEATQWFKNGDHPDDACTLLFVSNGTLKSEGKVVRHYRHFNDNPQRPCGRCERIMAHHGWIDTLEGGHIVCPGDWIITGVKGERYPCKDEIFAATYELSPVNKDINGTSPQAE